VYIPFSFSSFVLLHIWYSRFYSRENSRDLFDVLVVVCSLSLLLIIDFCFFSTIYSLLSLSRSPTVPHIYCLFLRMITLYAPCGFLFLSRRVGLWEIECRSSRSHHFFRTEWCSFSLVFFLCVQFIWSSMYRCVCV
jgi:hypothetical protein